MDERKGSELENDEMNPCVGCGPKNPIGLRLKFRNEGTQVSTTYVALEDHQGWPGRLHSGILYLAMLETANWTLYGRLGRVGLPRRTGALGTKRWVAIGEVLTLAGELRDAPNGGALVEVRVTDAHELLVATIEREYDLPSRAEFLQRMGYDLVPPGLAEVLPG